LEGEFTSLYKNRFLPEGIDSTFSLITESKPTKIIILADGDVARNDVNPRTGQPLQLGFDPISSYTFANQELLLNMVSYLVDDDGLINTRNKEVKIRPLNKIKIVEEKTFWQVVNLAVPIALLLIYGFIRSYLRKRKFTIR
jgi:gliding-associated putative ABC transporter substrate-binding component GldG